MAVSELDSGKGELRTILSIDGGGIRGIIPGVILAFLESELQVITMHAYISIFLIMLRSHLEEIQKSN